VVARDSRRARIASAATGLGAALVLAPVGYALTKGSETNEQTVGLGLQGAGLAQLTAIPKLFSLSPMEVVRDKYWARKASGVSGGALLSATEADWRAAAEHTAASRPVLGGIMLTIGGASLATGATFLLSHPGLLGMHGSTQANLGSSLVGGGAAVALIGAGTLLQRSIEESSWDAEGATRGVSPAVQVQVGLVPIRGGAALAAAVGF
jgi:hypothetical protein